ncbi:hypothetical protein FNV43_RR09691 [Rhamnella rubrinervis]|uniref:Uncharacterized protein n=1 Tax=Rhamnella rubrinervis TaxID=2594499 RepID=A0A8K0MK05_9ROSA|nr:hypothetical protein FNV43_RR09691 [Rhamnella rubrinervis]
MLVLQCPRPFNKVPIIINGILIIVVSRSAEQPKLKLKTMDIEGSEEDPKSKALDIEGTREVPKPKAFGFGTSSVPPTSKTFGFGNTINEIALGAEPTDFGNNSTSRPYSLNTRAFSANAPVFGDPWNQIDRLPILDGRRKRRRVVAYSYLNKSYEEQRWDYLQQHDKGAASSVNSGSTTLPVFGDSTVLLNGGTSSGPTTHTGFSFGSCSYPSTFRSFGFGSATGPLSTPKAFGFGNTHVPPNSKTFAFGRSLGPSIPKAFGFGISSGPSMSKAFSFGSSSGLSKPRSFTFGSGPTTPRAFSFGSGPTTPRAFSFGCSAGPTSVR